MSSVVIVENSTDTILGIPASQMQGPGIYTITNGAVSAFSPLPIPGVTPPGVTTPAFILSSQGLYTSVKAYPYGAYGDGIHDDTAAIAAARAAANAAGGGTVFYPSGTYLTGNQTLYPNVHDLGAGWEATIIKLKNGANADLFSANTANINLAASFGGGSGTGVGNWSIRHMSLDGNKANQSAGPSYCLRYYGYSYVLSDLHIRNGYSGNILCDWNPPSQPDHYIEPKFHNLSITDCNGIGVQMGGPTDGQWTNPVVAVTGSHCIHLAPLASAQQFSNLHVWQPGAGAVGILAESGYHLFSNCEAESSDTCQVVLLATRCTWKGGRIFAGSAASPSGIKLGQKSGETPLAGQILQSAGLTTQQIAFFNEIDTQINNCTGANGAIWLDKEQQNRIRAIIDQSSGTLFSNDFPAATTTIDIRPFNLTYAGNSQTGGATQITNHAPHGFAVKDGNNGNEYFAVDTAAGTVNIPNNSQLLFYSDFYSTVTLQVQGGTIGLAQSTTSPDPGNNGTINTANVGMARITPTANETGIILQAGTFNGQVCSVVNESASFSVTFAASGTSHVALGAGLTIAANSKFIFSWDSAKSLWY